MTNTQLWDSVCKTDPKQTKKFTKGGGFSGTAIKPFYLMRKATETFGICGIGWGWTEIENKMVGGVWCSKVQLWFMQNNQKGNIEQWGQTVMQGKNKNGDFVDEEAPKKAVTDAVTKCLSYLGFAGDVHMGLFDDSKYVDSLLKEAAIIVKQGATKNVETANFIENDPSISPFENDPSKPKSQFKNAAMRTEFQKYVTNGFHSAKTHKELSELMEFYKAKFKLMEDSGAEFDHLSLEEIRKQFQIAWNRLAHETPEEDLSDFHAEETMRENNQAAGLEPPPEFLRMHGGK